MTDMQACAKEAAEARARLAAALDATGQALTQVVMTLCATELGEAVTAEQQATMNYIAVLEAMVSHQRQVS
jgi:hypothetical protein